VRVHCLVVEVQQELEVDGAGVEGHVAAAVEGIVGWDIGESGHQEGS